jgi:uncharacterized membrane protein HdeD (DUF308 family)
MPQQWTEQLPGASRAQAAGTWVNLRLTEDDLKRARTALLVTGILAILTGIAAVAVPIVASVTIALFIGWVLVGAGLVMGYHAYSHRAQGTRQQVALRMLNAVLTFVVGLYILIFPHSGTVTLTFMLAVWFFASGFLALIAARHEWGMPGAGVLAFHGVLSLVLGILIAVSLPSSAAWAIGLLVGINLIFWGMRAVIAAQLLKKALAP